MARGDNPRNGYNGRFERTLTTVKRDADAAALRAQGLTYPKIAEQLGFRDQWAARTAVERALRDTVTEPASEVRVLELARLDHALMVAFRILRTNHLLTSGGKVVEVIDHETGQVVPLIDDKPKLQAIDRIIRIAERRARLLGLDAPTQLQLLTVDVIDAEIARLSAELGIEPGAVTAGEAEPTP